MNQQAMRIRTSTDDMGKQSKLQHKDSSVGAAMKRVALLVDGMARAAILPFGPRLVHRLSFQRNWYGAATELDSATWSRVPFAMAVVVGIYTLGRFLGVYLSQRAHLTQAKLPHHVARLASVAFALHIFTYGAGLNSVYGIAVIRFLSAILSGFLCGIADFALPEDTSVHDDSHSDDELMEEGLLGEEERMRKRFQYADVTPATAKLYMAGFAASILTGGLLYRQISESVVLQGLTGGYPLTISPLFFAAVTACVEFTLKCIFECSADRTTQVDAIGKGAVQTGGPVKRFVRGVVNRRVRISKTTAYSHDASHVQDHRHLLHDEDDALEFHDALSLSRHFASQHGHAARGTPSRSRINSARSETSMSEFFDCNSTLNDEIIDLDADPHTSDVAFEQGDASESAVAVYKDGRCVFPDGTPAFVPPGEYIGNVPQNYLDFYRGNHDKARSKYRETQEWRKQDGVWEIHRVPHPMFERIKDAYPHIIHGYSKTGQVVVYENPGKMNLKELFRSGCVVSDMLVHMTFFLEYIGNCCAAREEIRALNGGEIKFGTMVVMDVKGASVRSLTGDVLSYLSQSGALQSAHYPNVLKRVFVVNCPFWLAGAWSTVKGIVPESVHVEILSESNALEAMRKYIDDDQIPPEYGGSSPYPLGQHPYEVGCFDVAKNAGMFERDEIPDSIPEEPVLDTSYSFSRNEGPENDARNGNVSKMMSVVGSCDSELDDVGGESDILFLVSVMFTCWYAVQGMIEMAVPLWMLSPALLGGLGYSPSRSGMVLFCVSMVLLWNMRTKVARVVSQIPNKSPMRAFRIAVGSEAACLALLFIVPSKTTSTPRTESVLVMTSTIIFLSCTALASMLGRSGLAILHRIASESSQTPQGCDHSRWLRLSGEMLGVIIVAPLFCWSTKQERPSPFDGSCAFFAASLVAFGLYVASFSLHLNAVGERGCDRESSARRFGSFVREVVSVSVSDMASLLEEGNWSSCPLLGQSRGKQDRRKQARII